MVLRNKIVIDLSPLASASSASRVNNVRGLEIK